MRSIRSERIAASSIDTASLSFSILKPRSCSCITTTSLASLNRRFEKVIVNMAFGVEV
jgi:hypothetical protein